MAAALIAGVLVLGGLTLAISAYVLRTRCVAKRWSTSLFGVKSNSPKSTHTIGSGSDVEMQSREIRLDAALMEHVQLLAEHVPWETRRLKELVDANGVDSVRHQILAGLLLVEPTTITPVSSRPSSQRLEPPLQNLRAKADSPRVMDPSTGQVSIRLQDCIIDDEDFSPDDESYSLKLFVSLVQSAMGKVDVPQLANFMVTLEETKYAAILLSGINDMDLSDTGGSGDSKHETVILDPSGRESCHDEDSTDSLEGMPKRQREQTTCSSRCSPPTPGSRASSTEPLFPPDDSERGQRELWPHKVIAALDRRQSQESLLIQHEFHPSSPIAKTPKSPVSLKLSFNPEAFASRSSSGMTDICSLAISSSDRADSSTASGHLESPKADFNPICLADSPWRRGMQQVYEQIDPSPEEHASNCLHLHETVPSVGDILPLPTSHRGRAGLVLSPQARSSVDQIRIALADTLVEPDDHTKDDSPDECLFGEIECGWDYHPAKLATSDDAQRPEYASAPHYLQTPTPRSLSESMQSTPIHSPRVESGSPRIDIQ